MFSKREREGYVLIDHTDSPGFTCADVGPAAAELFGPGKKFEGGMLKCHRCDKQTILNPLRTRERGYCSRHDAHLCDECALTVKMIGVCQSFDEFIDLYLNRVANGYSPPILEALLNPGSQGPVA